MESILQASFEQVAYYYNFDPIIIHENGPDSKAALLTRQCVSAINTGTERNVKQCHLETSAVLVRQRLSPLNLIITHSYSTEDEQ